jgi:hypothetical protein
MMRSLVVPLTALVLVGGFALSAQAETIFGTLSGDATLTPTGVPGIYLATITGEGTDAVLGAFTLDGTTHINFSDPPTITLSDGRFSLIFDDGTLFGSGSGNGNATGKGTATAVSTLTITGGTGIFAPGNISGGIGEVVLDETITTTGPLTESITATYTGSLTVTPEPASLALLASGAAMVFRRRKARRALTSDLRLQNL